MIISKTLEQFYRNNSKDICRIVALFMKDSTDEEREDVVQGFYYAMLNYRTLDSFVCLVENTVEQNTKLFESYIWQSLRNFCNNCHRDDKSRVRRFNFVRTVNVGKPGEESPLDVAETLSWDRGANHGGIGINMQCEYSALNRAKEADVARTVEEFKAYLSKVRESSRRRQLMLKYIDWTSQDLSASVLAEAENVSSTYIKDIKRAVIQHYERFQKIQQVAHA